MSLSVSVQPGDSAGVLTAHDVFREQKDTVMSLTTPSMLLPDGGGTLIDSPFSAGHHRVGLVKRLHFFSRSALKLSWRCCGSFITVRDASPA